MGESTRVKNFGKNILKFPPPARPRCRDCGGAFIPKRTHHRLCSASWGLQSYRISVERFLGRSTP